MTNPVLRSAVWGGGGMLAGALAATLAMLPFRPVDPVGFEDLGWILMTMALGALLALVGGVVALLRGLSGDRLARRTAAVFVPLAVVLAAVSGGVAALAAPPLARWLVGALDRRRHPQPVGWGPR